MENPELIRDAPRLLPRGGTGGDHRQLSGHACGLCRTRLDEAQSRALICQSVELARKAREAYWQRDAQAGHAAGGGSVGRTARILPMDLNIAEIMCVALKSSPRSTFPAWRRAAGCGRGSAGL